MNIDPRTALDDHGFLRLPNPATTSHARHHAHSVRALQLCHACLAGAWVPSEARARRLTCDTCRHLEDVLATRTGHAAVRAVMSAPRLEPSRSLLVVRLRRILDAVSPDLVTRGPTRRRTTTWSAIVDVLDTSTEARILRWREWLHAVAPADAEAWADALTDATWLVDVAVDYERKEIAARKARDRARRREDLAAAVAELGRALRAVVRPEGRGRGVGAL